MLFLASICFICSRGFNGSSGSNGTIAVLAGLMGLYCLELKVGVEKINLTFSLFYLSKGILWSRI